MEDQKAKGEKKTERIRRKAIEILKDYPEGIHYAEWRRRIKAALPEANNNTIGGVIWDLDVKEPELVSKPAPGLFLHDFYQDTVTGGSDVAGETEVVEPRVEAQKRKEQDFYEPFADWLVKELEECTKAIAVGGRLFKDKWGTPDVIGIKEPRRGDLIKLPTEIVSAEIKLDSGSLITAFGQAGEERGRVLNINYSFLDEQTPEPYFSHLLWSRGRGGARTVSVRRPYEADAGAVQEQGPGPTRCSAPYGVGFAPERAWRVSRPAWTRVMVSTRFSQGRSSIVTRP